MKIFLPLLLFVHFNLPGSRQAEMVYVCVSPTSIAYHKSKDGCKGIQACTHQIIKISKADAINKYKYRACKICF